MIGCPNCGNVGAYPRCCGLCAPGMPIITQDVIRRLSRGDCLVFPDATAIVLQNIASRQIAKVFLICAHDYQRAALRWERILELKPKLLKGNLYEPSSSRVEASNPSVR